MAFLEEILRPDAPVETLVVRAIEKDAPPRRTLAKRLHEGLQVGGSQEAIARARSYRPRIALVR